MRLNFKAIYFILLVVFAWHLIALSEIFNPTLFPGPLKVLSSLLVMMESGSLFLDVFTSTWRMLAGLIFGTVIGVVFGLLMGRILFLEETTAPFLNILRAFPPVAIIPIMIVWFGIGDPAKILAIAFAVFFPVWISALVGAKSVHSDYLMTAKVFSKKPVEVFSKVVLPASVPFIMSGVRIAIAIAFIMVFVTELAGASSGLGYLIAYAQIVYRIDNMLAGLIVLGLLAAATDYLFVLLSHRLFPWVVQNGK